MDSTLKPLKATLEAIRGPTAFQPTVTQTNASDHWPVTRNFSKLS
jgi:hypothetical protein